MAADNRTACCVSCKAKKMLSESDLAVIVKVVEADSQVTWDDGWVCTKDSFYCPKCVRLSKLTKTDVRIIKPMDKVVSQEKAFLSRNWSKFRRKCEHRCFNALCNNCESIDNRCRKSRCPIINPGVAAITQRKKLKMGKDAKRIQALLESRTLEWRIKSTLDLKKTKELLVDMQRSGVISINETQHLYEIVKSVRSLLESANSEFFNNI